MASNEPVSANREVLRIDAADLLLDHANPRFGVQDVSNTQTELLDRIVGEYGVDDVLGSLAVNGYLEAEPLVCRRQPNSSAHVVVEGNRRLAACLVLLGDRRARRHERRQAYFAACWREWGGRPINPIPALVFEPHEQLKATLAYAGVRHIASVRAWDSHAKAAWVAKVVEAQTLSIARIAAMLGDRHGTVNRMLEGYYLVEQLTTSGHFRPQDSIRKGRGSVTDYPFSWVYTILGYVTVRNFLGLSDGDAHCNPLPPSHLERAGLLMRAMFGDRSRGVSAAIEDSRGLGALASAFASSDKVRLLEQGKNLAEAERLAQPIERQLAESLATVRSELRDLAGRLPERPIGEAAAAALLSASGSSRRLATELDKRLQAMAAGTDGD